MHKQHAKRIPAFQRRKTFLPLQDAWLGYSRLQMHLEETPEWQTVSRMVGHGPTRHLILTRRDGTVSFLKAGPRLGHSPDQSRVNPHHGWVSPCPWVFWQSLEHYSRAPMSNWSSHRCENICYKVWLFNCCVETGNVGDRGTNLNKVTQTRHDAGGTAENTQ